MTRVIFYDNLEPTPLEDEPDLVEVERIYCLRFDSFSKADWAELDAIYRRLPGGYRENQIPYWFGDSDDAPTYLSASVEPPGILVYGILSLEQWSRWDAALRESLELSALPLNVLR